LRLSVLFTVVAASLCICASAEAATVTVGSPLTVDFSGPSIGEVTGVNLTLGEPGAHATSPNDGTVVRWRMAGDYAGGPFRLVVLRPVGGEKYEATAASAPQTPVPGSGTVTFATSLPIRVGDLIGLNTATGSSQIGFAIAPQGSEFHTFSPPVEPGAPPQKIGGGGTEFELGFNADVEYATPPVIGPPPPPPVGHCLVPSLTGKKLKAVKKRLKKAGCKLGKVTKNDGATRKTGKVRKQSPKPGKSLPQGTKVAVTLKPQGRTGGDHHSHLPVPHPG
jgi:hypothetical protein